MQFALFRNKMWDIKPCVQSSEPLGINICYIYTDKSAQVTNHNFDILRRHFLTCRDRVN